MHYLWNFEGFCSHNMFPFWISRNYLLLLWKYHFRIKVWCTFCSLNYFELQLLKGHVHLTDPCLSPVIKVGLKIVQERKISSFLEISWPLFFFPFFIVLPLLDFLCWKMTMTHLKPNCQPDSREEMDTGKITFVNIPELFNIKDPACYLTNLIFFPFFLCSTFSL